MEKVKKTEAEWRAQLTPQQYSVAREKGTERPFTGEYSHSKEKGVYTCVCCGQALFDWRSEGLICRLLVPLARQAAIPESGDRQDAIASGNKLQRLSGSA